MIIAQNFTFPILFSRTPKSILIMHYFKNYKYMFPQKLNSNDDLFIIIRLIVISTDHCYIFLKHIINWL